VDPALLGGYLQTLAAVTAGARRLARNELDDLRAIGIVAAERGVPLTGVIDLHLSATWVAWRHLPRPRGSNPDDVATIVLRAANDAITALADGYETAQRRAIRQEEAVRREFIDDLLLGTSDLIGLADRAVRFGLQLAGGHTVAVARADLPFTDSDDSTRRIETALLTRFGAPNILITTKEGQLVCVASSAHGEALTAFANQTRMCRQGSHYQIGIGRPHSGPAGVALSYREAGDVLDLAGRLDLDTTVLRAEDLLVFQVLFRDRAAITDLVTTVLSPLRQARGGARPLIDTLAAYFDTGNAVSAAQRLNVAVRTITYRLQRIRALTGYNPTDPAQRYTLETAVFGARLLGWPSEPDDR
jgi:sugar diacid utilization regulator